MEILKDMEVVEEEERIIELEHGSPKEIKMYNQVKEMINMPHKRFEILANLVEEGKEIDKLMKHLRLKREG